MDQGQSDRVNAAEKPGAVHVQTIQSANRASDADVPVWRALSRNPKIIAWCCYANIGAFMYGFDNLALSVCLSMVPFQEQFGEPGMTAHGPGFIIPAYWQSLWNALAQVATMLGALSIGAVSDRFGRKSSFLLASLISFAGIAVVYTAVSPGVFLAGKMINAVALGMAIATGQTYVSEISPLRIRGILLSAFTFSLNLGYLVAASIALNRTSIMTKAAYKVIFAAEWAWPGLLLLLIWFVPESPHHLVRKEKMDKAKESLQRLHNSAADIPALLQDVVNLARDEKAAALSSRDTTYLECFKGTNWRRTRIILYANGISQMIGATFQANGPYFLVSAGMSSSHVTMIIELGIGFGIISSVITWFCLVRFGRRQITLFGVGLAAVIFIPMGIAGCFPKNTSALWTVGVTLQMLWFTFGPAIGPATAIAGEISTVRLRSKSQSIGFMFNYFFSTVWNVIVPYMFNVDQGNLGGKMGFIFLATSIIAFVVLFLEMPETKDRTYADLDTLFAMKIPTRKFLKTNTENLAGENNSPKSGLM